MFEPVKLFNFFNEESCFLLSSASKAHYDQLVSYDFSILSEFKVYVCHHSNLLDQAQITHIFDVPSENYTLISNLSDHWSGAIVFILFIILEEFSGIPITNLKISFKVNKKNTYFPIATELNRFAEYFIIFFSKIIVQKICLYHIYKSLWLSWEVLKDVETKYTS